MMYGLSGAMPMRMAHPCSQFRSPEETDLQSRAARGGRAGPETGARAAPAHMRAGGHCGSASGGGRGWGAGWGAGWGHGPFGRFVNSVCAASFADRVQTENRMAYRAEACEIRCGIGSLMKSVEGGRLSADQQGEFDALVGRLAELRERAGFRGGQCSDPEELGDRILARYGVERAPAEPARHCGCDEAAEAGTEAAADAEGAVVESGTETAAATEEVDDSTAVTEPAEVAGTGLAAAETDSAAGESEETAATVAEDMAETMAADAAQSAVGAAVDELLDELAA